MHSRYLRTMLSNVGIGLLIEYAVCYAIAAYFNDENEFFYALLFLVGFWILQAGVSLKNLIVSTIHYYLIGKRDWVSEIQATLRRGKFPIYDDHLPDAHEYLRQVMADDKVTYDQLVLAASSLGQLEILKPIKPTLAWRFMSVLETALDNYRRAAS